MTQLTDCRQDVVIESFFGEFEQSRQGKHGVLDIKDTNIGPLAKVFLDGISDIIVQYDSCGKVAWANRAACDFLGRELKSIIGTGNCELFFVTKQDCSDCPVRRTLETNEPQQKKMCFVDGSVRFVRSYPLGQPGQNNRGVLGVAFKIELQGCSEADLHNFYRRLSQLSPREKQVMHLVAEGKANKVIAIELDISPKTVEIHRSRVMDKLGVDSVATLVRYISKSEKILDPFNSNYFCL